MTEQTLEQLAVRSVQVRQHYEYLASLPFPEDQPSRSSLRIALDEAFEAAHLAETLYHNARFQPLDLPTKGTWRTWTEEKKLGEGGKVEIERFELITHNKETEE